MEEDDEADLIEIAFEVVNQIDSKVASTNEDYAVII